MKVTLYSSSSCTSCRKARKWLEENNIPFTERNIFKQPLTEDEIKDILRLTEDGTEEIISTRSKVFTDMHIRLDDLKLGQLVALIQEKPAILKRPIMMDDRRRTQHKRKPSLTYLLRPKSPRESTPQFSSA